ncbi:MAG: transposase domain-containing protein [Pseudomonadota bacterium]|nr:transposase domain-containing protein [Pseudomonadota bacterium]
MNGGDGWMIPPEALSREARKKLLAEIIPAPAPDAAPVAVSREEYRTMMDAYERKPSGLKRRAEQAAVAVAAFLELRESGLSVAMAEKSIADSHGMSKATLWRARTDVSGVDRQYWEVILCPRYHGGRGKTEFTPEAYDWILGKYLRKTEPPLSAIMPDARKEAAKQGWIIPSDKTVQARINEEPAWKILAGRKGEKALERSFPTVERDYTSLRLHEMWESDGRRMDVWCVWRDGSIGRPHSVIWRECRTRMPLAIRVYKSESGELVINSLASAFELTGTRPENAKIDNGRAYANKAMTGGQPTRYRFTVNPDEPIGIMTRAGILARWSKPGQGRDKPVESFWNYVANHCDKAPEFEGAYCGRNPVEKPEGFDARKAVPIAAYLEKLKQVVWRHASEKSHRGQGMDGKTPLALYEELSRDYIPNPVDPAILRLCRMGVATVKPDKRENSLKFKMDGYGEVRYWDEAIAALPQRYKDKKFSIYYDIGDPLKPVVVYDGDKLICEARNIGRIEFNEAGGEKTGAHMKAKGAYLKPRRAALKDAKAAAPSSLPALIAAGAGMTQPPFIAINEPAKLPAPPPALPAPSEEVIPHPGHPGEFINQATSKIYRGTAPALPTPANDESEEDRLAEMARRQQEKNLPDWVRGNAPARLGSTD